jgi:hypothetical protein
MPQIVRSLGKERPPGDVADHVTNRPRFGERQKIWHG